MSDIYHYITQNGKHFPLEGSCAGASGAPKAAAFDLIDGPIQAASDMVVGSAFDWQPGHRR